MNELFFIYNNDYFPLHEPVVSAGNHGLRYGDGLFETMRIYNGRIINIDFHFDRLFSGLDLLQFKIPDSFTSSFFAKKINELLIRNEHGENARVRLMVFRGESSTSDPENESPNYIIETWPLSPKIELNEKGLVIDIFPEVRKSCDQFSNLKSNNYLRSVMAGLFAKKNGLDDAIILNVFEKVCESSIANIFIVKDENIYTPPLSEGCVAGTMRRWILKNLSLKNYVIAEKNLSIDDVLSADEFFLTNSIYPIRWVKSFRNRTYENQVVKKIYQFYNQMNLSSLSI